MLPRLFNKRMNRSNTSGVDNNAESGTFVNLNNFSIKHLDYEVNPTVIEFNCLTVGIEIGHGGFGNVYKGTYNNQSVAVKKAYRKIEKKTLLKEAQLLSLVKHNNIVGFYGYCDDPQCVVLEYCGGGTLGDILRSQNAQIIKSIKSNTKWSFLKLSIFFNWALQIAAGMRYLHDEAPVSILHRDLKSLNILIKQNLPETFDADSFEIAQFWKKCILKISDFGLSRETYRTTPLSDIGTCAWMAPEVCRGEQMTKGSDVWSYGVILWEMMTGNTPHNGISNFAIQFNIGLNKIKLQVPKNCLKTVANIFNNCWLLDHIRRPSFANIFTNLKEAGIEQSVEKKYDLHEIVKNNDLDKLENILKESFEHINLKDNNGYAAIVYAVKNDYHFSFRDLIISGAKVDDYYFAKMGTKDNGFNLMHFAAYHNSESCLKELLKLQKLNIDVKTKENENTALHLAAKYGHSACLKILIDAGANIESFNADKQTPAIRAAMCNKFDCLEILIKNGANLEAMDKWHNTALSEAAECDSADCLKLLIKNNAKVNIQSGITWGSLSTKGNTELHRATLRGNIECLKLLIAANSNPTIKNFKGQNALDIAIENERVECSLYLREILQNGGYEKYEIHDAVIEGDVEKLKILLQETPQNDDKKLQQKTTNVDQRDASDRTAIFYAVTNNQFDCLKILIEKGCQIENTFEVENFTLLHLAAMYDSVECLRILMEQNKIKIEEATKTFDRTALHYAAEFGNNSCLKCLIQSGADKNSRTIRGDTPLILAAVNEQREILKTLIDANSDINAVDCFNESAFHKAARIGGLDCLKLLVDKSPQNLTIKSLQGLTPLDIAKLNGNNDCVTFLNSVIAKQPKSIYPLHDAVIQGDITSVQKLLKNATSPDFIDLKDENGRAAVFYAVSCNQSECLQLLIQKNATISEKYNLKEYNKMTLLHIAVHFESVDCLNELLKTNQIDIEAKHSDKAKDFGTALHYSVILGDYQCTKILLDAGADIECIEGGKRTPLLVASLLNKLYSVKILLQYKANVDAQDVYNNTALINAVENDNIQMVKLLIEAGANPILKSYSETALDFAKLNSYKECFEYLENIISTRYYNVNQLHYLAKRGNADALKQILQNEQAMLEINLKNDKNKSAVFYAVKNNQIECLKILINKDASITDLYDCPWCDPMLQKSNHSDLTLLHIAVIYDSADCLIELLKTELINVNSISVEIGTPLHIVILNYILRKKYRKWEKTINRNENDDSNNSKNECDIDKGDSDCGDDNEIQNEDTDSDDNVSNNDFDIRCLRAQFDGRGVEICDYEYQTALIISVNKNNFDDFKILMKFGANVNTVDNNNVSVLSWASCLGRTRFVLLLLEKGAKINDQDIDGDTALHNAAYLGEIECLKALISAKADQAIRNDKGQTALDCAIEKSQIECIEVLKQFTVRTD